MDWFVFVGIGFVLWGLWYLWQCRRRRRDLGDGERVVERNSGVGVRRQRRSDSELDQLFDDYDRDRRSGGR